MSLRILAFRERLVCGLIKAIVSPWAPFRVAIQSNAKVMAPPDHKTRTLWPFLTIIGNICDAVSDGELMMFWDIGVDWALFLGASEWLKVWVAKT